MTKIEVGMIVKYAPGWCSEGEEKYLHIVKENRLNPVTGKMTRWLIQTINTNLNFMPTQVVEECMIQPADTAYEQN